MVFRSVASGTESVNDAGGIQVDRENFLAVLPDRANPTVILEPSLHTRFWGTFNTQE